MINLNLFFRSLSANSLQANSASRLSGRARAVAFISFTGLALSIFTGASPLEDGLQDLTPKAYIRTIFNHEQALCLIKLYGKESAFNPYAIGNTHSIDADYAYGIPQIKNPALAFMSPIEQVNAGIDYIEHRYTGNTCLAYAHYLKKGWH